MATEPSNEPPTINSSSVRLFLTRSRDIIGNSSPEFALNPDPDGKGQQRCTKSSSMVAFATRPSPRQQSSQPENLPLVCKFTHQDLILLYQMQEEELHTLARDPHPSVQRSTAGGFHPCFGCPFYV